MESNPEVMTKFLTDMGMSDEWAVVDVLGFEDELLQMLPQPVKSVILLYDVKKVSEGDRGDSSVPEGVFYMEQTIQNACGTIALLHAVGNNLDSIKVTPGSLLDNFFQETKELSPAEIGKKLESNTDLASSHESSAQEGQTAAPDISTDVYYHFIALIQKNGKIYELDGRKSGPVDRGVSSPDSFVSDAASVCKSFIDQNPDCLDFTAVALVKLSGES